MPDYSNETTPKSKIPVKTRCILLLSRLVALGVNGVLMAVGLGVVVYLIYLMSVGLTSAGF